MDDESYVKFDFIQIPGKIFYAAKKRGLSPINIHIWGKISLQKS